MSDPKISLVFPGQGSQTVGMGQALALSHSAAKAVFDEVDDALGEALSATMWDGPQDALTLTVNAQPALMAHAVATFRALEAEGFTLAQTRSLAGHSLGEYAAHCVAGTYSLADTARLLRLRGEAMQSAVPVGEGGMAAILGLDLGAVEALLEGTGCEVANDNAPGQVVISGLKGAVEAACVAAKDAGAKRALPLPVSAPFHCQLMAPAAAQMEEALAAIVPNSPARPVFANTSAAPVGDGDIAASLVSQVTGRVRWTETIQAMAADGTDTFIELGAGKVLCGLIKRIEKGVNTMNVGAPDDIANLRDVLQHS